MYFGLDRLVFVLCQVRARGLGQAFDLEPALLIHKVGFQSAPES